MAREQAFYAMVFEESKERFADKSSPALLWGALPASTAGWMVFSLVLYGLVGALFALDVLLLGPRSRRARRAYREASAESQRELGPIQEAYLSALKRVAAETSAEETVN